MKKLKISNQIKSATKTAVAVWVCMMVLGLGVVFGALAAKKSIVKPTIEFNSFDSESTIKNDSIKIEKLSDIAGVLVRVNKKNSNIRQVWISGIKEKFPASTMGNNEISVYTWGPVNFSGQSKKEGKYDVYYVQAKVEDFKGNVTKSDKIKVMVKEQLTYVSLTVTPDKVFCGGKQCGLFSVQAKRMGIDKQSKVLFYLEYNNDYRVEISSLWQTPKGATQMNCFDNDQCQLSLNYPVSQSDAGYYNFRACIVTDDAMFRECSNVVSVIAQSSDCNLFQTALEQASVSELDQEQIISQAKITGNVCPDLLTLLQNLNSQSDPVLAIKSYLVAYKAVQTNLVTGKVKNNIENIVMPNIKSGKISVTTLEKKDYNWLQYVTNTGISFNWKYKTLLWGVARPPFMPSPADSSIPGTYDLYSNSIVLQSLDLDNRVSENLAIWGMYLAGIDGENKKMSLAKVAEEFLSFTIEFFKSNVTKNASLYNNDQLIYIDREEIDMSLPETIKKDILKEKVVETINDVLRVYGYYEILVKASMNISKGGNSNYNDIVIKEKDGTKINLKELNDTEAQKKVEQVMRNLSNDASSIIDDKKVKNFLAGYGILMDKPYPANGY